MGRDLLEAYQAFYTPTADAAEKEWERYLGDWELLAEELRTLRQEAAMYVEEEAIQDILDDLERGHRSSRNLKSAEEVREELLRLLRHRGRLKFREARRAQQVGRRLANEPQPAEDPLELLLEREDIEKVAQQASQIRTLYIDFFQRVMPSMIRDVVKKYPENAIQQLWTLKQFQERAMALGEGHSKQKKLLREEARLRTLALILRSEAEGELRQSLRAPGKSWLKKAGELGLEKDRKRIYRQEGRAREYLLKGIIHWFNQGKIDTEKRELYFFFYRYLFKNKGWVKRKSSKYEWLKQALQKLECPEE